MALTPVLRPSAYREIATKTTNYVATANDDVILVNAAATTRTVTLPAAAGLLGKQLTVKKTSVSNSVIVDGNLSETIDGAASKTITTQWGFLTVLCDGTGWMIVASGGTIT
jgi:hypothetical protein